MSPETEVEQILSRLQAYKDPQVCWGVTVQGWLYYSTHPDQRVRDAVAAHPYRFIAMSYQPSKDPPLNPAA